MYRVLPDGPTEIDTVIFGRDRTARFSGYTERSRVCRYGAFDVWRRTYARDAATAALPTTRYYRAGEFGEKFL